ncbi:hypothetical protein D1AOALGA4SA_12657 [Olavius algarvensis Delta 1 endosymbiont]|nr:hypothetical protein D1AOALGA4SA_12657 [Olavius algarvensis Delta 1 endosymbiont]
MGSSFHNRGTDQFKKSERQPFSISNIPIFHFSTLPLFHW